MTTQSGAFSSASPDRLSALQQLERWWWPVFVFLSPLLVTAPGQQFRNDLIAAKYLFGVLALLGGVLLEWAYRTPARTSPRYTVPRTPLFDLRIAPVLLFGLWAVVSGLWAPEPVFALLGLRFEIADASIWTLTVTLCAWLVYLRCQRDPEVVRLLCFAAAGAGALLGALAALEVVLGRALVYPIGRVDIPEVSFPQRGHLAGFLVLCFGVALAAMRWRNGLMLTCALLCSLGVGVTFNRTSLLAVVIAIALCLLVQWRRYLLPGLLSLALIGVGWWMGQTFNVQGTRELATSQTVATRSYMWKAALVGIAERPLTGWGGNSFTNVWSDKVSFEDLKTYLKLEYGETLITRIPDTNLLRVRTPAGQNINRYFSVWKSHNQLIEVTLLYGIPGLLIYLWMLVNLLRNRFLSNPAAIGVLAYHIFFMLWFAIPESDAVLWGLIGVGLAATSSATTQPPKPQPALEHPPAQA